MPKSQEKITVFMTVDGEETEVTLPTKFKVCPKCRGKGTHVNPSIDGNGLTREDFDEDPDFKESYFRGDYDVTCHRCEGRNVIAVLDRGACTKAQREAYDAERESLAEIDAIHRAEIAMGC